LFRLKGNDVGDIVSLWALSDKDFSDWPLPEKQRGDLEFVIDRFS
jgi:hypothetical protein